MRDKGINPRTVRYIARMNEHLLFNLVDLAGTFAFAISGATAARRAHLDLFGILAIAFITSHAAAASSVTSVLAPFRRWGCRTGATWPPPSWRPC
jgi:hypothetical protein